VLYKNDFPHALFLSFFSCSYQQQQLHQFIMTVLPLKDSKDPQAKVALERIEQIKSQLNLSSSPMSRQAPKDMAAERAAAEFNIEALAILWAGSEKRYNLIKKANEYIKNDPELVVQPPRNFLELSRDEMRELYVFAVEIDAVIPIFLISMSL